ncbi:MAG: saccharopine dehydrogenase C-terminal domain-containing protein [Ferruginibacter sp.]
MKTVVLFGAGKSATVLISYLLKEAENNNWQIIIADSNKDIIEQKTKLHPSSEAVEVDITDTDKRHFIIKKADVVISMMPASLHILIAQDCIEFKKNLLTASYVDENIKALNEKAVEAGILFLCEMGLDPGIDHMSAMKIFDEIKEEGGKVTSFKSHCGGLVAPESDDNPWRYKISWNPRNVVLAGKSGAVYLKDAKEVTEDYEQLFSSNRELEIDQKEYSYYPNRNSLSYIDLYSLHDVKTFVRTTLRYPEFMSGWDKIIKLKLTDEVAKYDTEGLSLESFFINHFKENNLSELFLQLNDDYFKEQMYFFGLKDNSTFINKGFCSAADVMQFILETKLPLLNNDKDLVVMCHEVEYTVNEKRKLVTSSLCVKGNDSMHTAMAKTVGLPLGIATKLLLEGKIKLTGVHIPVNKEIYLQVLKELEKNDIIFSESTINI